MNIDIVCNVEDEVLFQNVEINSRRDLEWITETPAHDGHAVIVGGGPSLADSLETIRWRKSIGQKIFALNGAYEFLHDHGIRPDYQVILDARPENKGLVTTDSNCTYLLASQCAESVVDYALEWGGDVLLWHPKIDGIEGHLPDQRESLTLIGGGTTVGLSAMCLAYTMGYRKLHLFGYDSSHRETGHAYRQSMNDKDAVCKVTVFGKTFTASLAMAKQAEFFPTVCDNLLDLGCIVTVDGDGLLPYMTREIAKRAASGYVVKPGYRVLSEQEKYEAMWSIPGYRNTAPGEQCAETFVQVCRPEGTVIDFGCGTGRGSLVIERLTECKLLLIDFTENSRDPEAMRLPFLQADLSQPLSVKGDYGFCTDVMEHLPTAQVDQTIQNIMEATPRAFFQISLVPDNFGAVIGHPLHLTVQPCRWWFDAFVRLGYSILYYEDKGDSVMFYISTT